jgi:hypothetical protein
LGYSIVYEKQLKEGDRGFKILGKVAPPLTPLLIHVWWGINFEKERTGQ